MWKEARPPKLPNSANLMGGGQDFMTLQEFEKITSNSGVSRDDGNNVQTVQGNLYNWTLVYLPAGNDRMGNSMITIVLFQEI